jgi:hypothetical protein
MSDATEGEESWRGRDIKLPSEFPKLSQPSCVQSLQAAGSNDDEKMADSENHNDNDHS